MPTLPDNHLTKSAVNKEIVRRSRDELWNGRDITSIDRYFSENMVSSLYGRGSDREQMKDFARDFLHAIPDLRFEIEDIIAEEDRVAIRWRIEGTQTGILFGAEPTGSTFNVAGFSFDRIEGNLICETWPLLDKHSLSRAIGTNLV